MAQHFVCDTVYKPAGQATKIKLFELYTAEDWL
jgi:hypothetical protein